MALPITGPTIFLVSNDVDAQGSSRLRRVRYKQRKPYDLVAPYEFQKLYMKVAMRWATGQATPPYFGGFANVNSSKNPGDISVSPDTPTQYYQNELDFAVNSARSKFIGKLGEAASLAVTLAERKQAMSMIERRGRQLLGAATALRRGGPVAFVKALKLSITKKVRKDQKRWARSRQFSNYWLEYHFGWTPLVRDIGLAVDTLQRPIPMGRIRAKGFSVNLFKESRVTSGLWPMSQTFTGKKLEGFVRAHVGADVYISNPNAFLANKLGFTNPAIVAWELVPFSFVVDWFVNVGEFLQSFSELHGVTTANGYTTWLMKLGIHFTQNTWHRDFYSPPPRWATWGTSHQVLDSDGVWMKRVQGIPSVTLGVRPPWRLSNVRAATAISLLVQQGLRG
ncbi:maturation protein [ssRNA phage SRR6049586_1]|uniref:Maturation protein n=1 Tax=ssRNA phage SRR6049586_1 TaxID=2786480 RepID=A0A8S5L0G6_9VIRU|nr:maturation protein [ssRNA phage SRR6049586_1]DAD50927.1 TPA_asm: maturation protein [ssRNA phage SRR6049586_1]